MTFSSLPPFGLANGKRNTKFVGLVSEAAAILRFVELGYRVSLPFGESSPYDLIIEDCNGRLVRVQVKTGRIRDGHLRFSAVSYHAHRNAPPTRYDDKIEAFAVFCPDNGELYFIPADDPAVRPDHGWLRIDPPRNNMRKGIHWARNYLLRKPADAERGDLGSLRCGALDED